MNKIWKWFRTEEVNKSELRDAIIENKSVVASTIKKSKENKRQAAAIVRTAEDALDILNRIEITRKNQ